MINFFSLSVSFRVLSIDESLYLEYIIDKFPEPPRHVRFNPPKQSFLSFLKFCEMYAIDPIVSGMNINLNP